VVDRDVLNLGACALCTIIAMALECRSYFRESQLLAANKAADED